MAFLGYTTKDIKCYPLASSGPTVSSPGTAWVWGDWVDIVPEGAITSDFVILTLVTFEDPTAALDTRHETILALQTKVGATLTIIAWIRVAWLIDSAVGHTAPWILPLPIPRRCPANAGIQVSVCHSEAAVRTFGPNKIVYIELPYI